MTTQELVQYYANLLILQYVGLPRAFATIEATARPIVMPQTTVQLITFSAVPTAGTFVISWDNVNSSSIGFGVSSSGLQTILRAVTGLGTVTVSGDTTVGFTVVFTGVTPIADLLVLVSSTLTASSVPVSVAIDETDVTLPVAVQNAFNLIGDDTAVGVQLDVLGKYVGVTRSGNGFSGPITLDDADFLSLIRMAIVTNSSGSSLATIVGLLNQFFPGLILVFDFKNMQMSYLIDSAIGSYDLAQIFVTEGLLPKPMAVQVASVIYSPDIRRFFGCTTYEDVQAGLIVPNSPFNTYQDYEMNRPFLVYQNAIVV